MLKYHLILIPLLSAVFLVGEADIFFSLHFLNLTSLAEIISIVEQFHNYIIIFIFCTIKI